MVYRHFMCAYCFMQQRRKRTTTYSFTESEMLFTNGIIFPAEGGEQSISFTIMNQTWWNSQIIPTNSSEWCTVEYKYNFEQSNESDPTSMLQKMQNVMKGTHSL